MLYAIYYVYYMRMQMCMFRCYRSVDLVNKEESRVWTGVAAAILVSPQIPLKMTLHRLSPLFRPPMMTSPLQHSQPESLTIPASWSPTRSAKVRPSKLNKWRYRRFDFIVLFIHLFIYLFYHHCISCYASNKFHNM